MIVAHISVDGADYMATWFLGDMKTYVSVVSGEVKNMLLDFLIVPVNSSMFGEDLLTAQGLFEFPYVNFTIYTPFS